MTVKHRVEKLEAIKATKPDLIVVSPEKDGLYFSRFYDRNFTRQELDELDCRVVIWESHRRDLPENPTGEQQD